MARRDTNPTRRRRPSRDTKPVTYIFCEGEKTEPIYFARWRERGISLHIIPVSHTDPMGIVNDAKQKMSERSFEPSQGDSVWCIYDVDANSDDALEKAFSLARRNGYKIVISNPCFELWYILHFELPGRSLTSAEAQALLSKLIPGYSKSVDVFEQLESIRAKAMSNAARLKEKYGETFKPMAERDCNPFTNADVLVQTLLRLRERVRTLSFR